MRRVEQMYPKEAADVSSVDIALHGDVCLTQKGTRAKFVTNDDYIHASVFSQ